MTLPPRQPDTGVFISSSKRRPTRRRRALGLSTALAAAALAVGVALGALWLAERDVLPARTTIGGVDVGRRTVTEARLLVGEAAVAQVKQPVSLTADDYSVEVTGSLLGASPNVDAAIDEADDVGLFGRLGRRLGLGETRDVPLRYRFEPTQLQALTRELERRLSVEPRNARLVVTGATTRVRPAREGQTVAGRRLATQLSTLPRSLTIPIATVAPPVSTESAVKAQRVADKLLSEPRRVALGSVTATIPPSVLGRAITTEAEGRGLRLSLDPDVLRARLAPVFRELERSPADAGFRVDGSRVFLVPAREGRELDVVRIARSLLTNLRSTWHRARFVAIPPSLTTADAEKLRIRELVSEFTTYYPCCAPRVTNIQRAAALLDGTILRAGETFSLNNALGQRTVEKGFVAAPQIRAGRLEDAVGGGISQVATTLYNAAFFAGLRLDAHQPHEFYISRYPMGREATVSWRSPELIFTNDWGAGLLMKVNASDTGINVRFYSSRLGRRVETETGDPYDTVPPRVITSRNPSLAPGERSVIQDAGASGFTVRYTRKVWRGSTLKRDESFTVRYRPQNSYVELGPPKKPKPEKPQKKPEKPKKPGAADPEKTPTEPSPGGGEPTTGGGVTVPA